ncbi:S8 family peptidase [Cryobacterium frigoriphilum]|uniref:S8 family peptidase n=1 Tax=Cryobacterium frigoriphilum TaxID=1259150 RepID=UPI00141BD6E8|nr:S8 family serine peptidase [Cryobacterium frigoriphilum]
MSIQKSVKIAIVDSGLNDGSADFSCFDVVDSDDDVQGHGTIVASVAVGLVDDECPLWADKVSIITYSVFGDETASPNEMATAIHTAIEDKVDLINISIAIGTDVKALRVAVRRAIDSGIIVIAASGNNLGMRAGYPARYPDVISVGSLDTEGRPSSFSAIADVDYFIVGTDVPSVDRAGIQQFSTGTSIAAANTSNQVLKALLGVVKLDSTLAELIADQRKQSTR